LQEFEELTRDKFEEFIALNNFEISFSWNFYGVMDGTSSYSDNPINYSLDIANQRKTEIIEWINKHKLKPEEVLIIDDDKSLNDLPLNFKERLVLTNPYIGLSNQNEFTAVLNKFRL